jgi:imidazolonepropionase-like amidohydrolase
MPGVMLVLNICSKGVERITLKNYLFRLSIIAVVSILLPTPVLKAQTTAKASETLVLVSVTVIDGNGGRPKPDMTLVISNGRILDMYRSGKKKPPTGATVMDLSGQYVIPGLIDSHYHLNLGTRSKTEEEAYRRFALLGGITTVRDMAGDGIALAELAKVASDRNVQSPRVYFSALMAGKTWFVDQRVSILMHGLPAGEAAWARAIMPDTNIIKAVTEAKNTGATGIKLYADLSPDIVAKVTKEAHRQGLKVWSHATIFPSKPSDAVAAGVDVLSHSHFLAWEFVNQVPEVSDKASNRMVGWTSVSVDSPKITALLKQMRKRGTMLDDTAVWSILRFVPAIERSEAAKPEAERTPGYTKAIESWTYNIVNRVHKFGIPIVAGTDFQEQPRTQEFPNIHTELVLLATKCGLTPLEAITTATRNGAIALGIQNSYGTIAKGKVADLVILSADPSTDIRDTTKILYVIKGGKVHKREKVAMPAT